MLLTPWLNAFRGTKRPSRAARSAREFGRTRLQMQELEDRVLLSATVYPSGDVPQAIPDQATIVSTINVGDSVTVDDVNVTLDISHARDQDLDVFLIAPDGTRVELFTDVGGGGDNFSGTTLDDEAAGAIIDGAAPFAGEYRPEGSLAALDGQDSQGLWQLEVTDDKRRETGTLNSWSIEITSAQPALPEISISDVTVTEGDDAAQFIDAFVSAGSGGLDGPLGITLGPDGNLYVTSTHDNKVVRYDGTTGAFVDVFVTTGSGGLDRPREMVFGADGNLYVSSGRGSEEVLRYQGPGGASPGAFIDAFVTSGSGGLDSPYGLVFGPDGNFYVSSTKTNDILRYDGSTGAFIDVFVTSGSGGINSPRKLEFAADGNLYVASTGSHSILRYDGTTGAFIDALVPTGSGGIDTPFEFTFGPDGNMYVSNTSPTVNSRDVLRYEGLGGASPGAFIDVFIPAGTGGLDNPVGLLFDADGILYVASANTNQVLRYGVASQAVFTVFLSSPSATTVTVDFTTADGTAIVGSDYTATSGTVVFAPGETTKTIIVATLNDADIEGDETFVVNLSNESGSAAIADGQGEATISDDDAPVSDPVIDSLTDSPDPVKQGQTLTLTAGVTGTLDSVSFYRDNNGNGTLDVGTDTLLGTDGDGGDGWSVSVGIPGNFSTGFYTYFAQGTFDGGASTTNVAAATGEVIKRKGGGPNSSSLVESSSSTSTSLATEEDTAAEDAARLVAAALSDPTVTEPLTETTVETLATEPLSDTSNGDETDHESVYAELGSLQEKELTEGLLV